jgi:hypothetical protein
MMRSVLPSWRDMARLSTSSCGVGREDLDDRDEGGHEAMRATAR